ncbi:hypothetical protein DPX16_15343 [Anabarilius grahami]|uniref:Uncharacterized protein n=1 Tax=Anabarilius grahami TaxID=495550 RepID=A0A3N0XWC7_ANAGA|nr:hypothetical protein DPX16_15343 [Anabarilius grahami]
MRGRTESRWMLDGASMCKQQSDCHLIRGPLKSAAAMPEWDSARFSLFKDNCSFRPPLACDFTFTLKAPTEDTSSAWEYDTRLYSRESSCRRQEHTKPTVGRRAVYVRRPTKFSQCVPHRRLKLVLDCFFSADSTLELVGPSGHLIILTGSSATATCWYGKVFLLTQAQNGRPTWPSAVERRFGVSGQLWTSDAADLSPPRSLLSSPLVRRLGVFLP